VTASKEKVFMENPAVTSLKRKKPRVPKKKKSFNTGREGGF
jgi:hypothetical protein